MKQITALGIVTLNLYLCATSAYAGSATSSFTVSATVVSSCTISATTLAFGNYDPIVANATTALDVNGSVTITCTKGAATTIGLDPGQERRKCVWDDPRHGNRWPRLFKLRPVPRRQPLYVVGNSGANLYTRPVAPTKNARTFTIYGRIPAAQGSTIGSYTDTVVATVNF